LEWNQSGSVAKTAKTMKGGLSARNASLSPLKMRICLAVAFLNWDKGALIVVGISKKMSEIKEGNYANY
jgi:hypothetical protein